jgi:hypothetical protein
MTTPPLLKDLVLDTILQIFKASPSLLPFVVPDTTTLHFLVIYLQNPSKKIEPRKKEKYILS